MSRELKTIMVVGPTATGKSAFAFSSALERRIPILNADSIQFYKFVDVGSAKPTIEEMSQVEHALVSVVDPPHEFNAGEFRRAALAQLEAWDAKAHMGAFIVGGSGFYLKALENGMFENEPITPEVREKVDREVAERGFDEIWLELRSLDPDCTRYILQPDHYRIRRAWEIFRQTGLTPTRVREKFTQVSNAEAYPYQNLKIGFDLPREELMGHVQARTRRMLEKGMVDEVQGLMARGLADWAPLKSVGYREVVQMLTGQLSHNELFEAIVTATLQLAKKQRTWFRRDPSIQWFHPERESAKARDLVRSFMSEK